MWGGWFHHAYPHQTLPFHFAIYGFNQVRQFDPCDNREGNPCVPATGAKELDAVDFDWQGTQFSRHYTSIAQLPLHSGFGDSWAHPFSQRIYAPQLAGGSVMWVNSRGRYEELKPVEGMAVYTSENIAGSVLRFNSVSANESWTLYGSNGEQTGYDASGRLLRVGNGASALSVLYCEASHVSSGECQREGLIRKVTAKNGRTLRFNFAMISGYEPGPDGAPLPKLRLSSLSDDWGTRVSYGYDEHARLDAVTYPGSTGSDQLRYLYAEQSAMCRAHDGSLITSCDPAAKSAEFVNHLTGIQNELGVRYASYTYDGQGRVTQSEHANAAGRVALEYLSGGAVQVSLASGAQRLYQFGSGKYFRAQAVADMPTDGSGAGTATYEYDPISLRKTFMIDRRGFRTDYHYDALRMTGKTEGLLPSGDTTADTRTSSSEWDNAINRPLRRIESGRETRFAYNSRAETTATCEVDTAVPTATAYQCGSQEHAPEGVRQTRMAYCEKPDVTAPGSTCPILGLLKSVDGPRIDVTDVTRYAYFNANAPGCDRNPSGCSYRKGDLQRVTNASGHVTEYLAYDAAGRVKQVRDANGVVSEMDYHPRGWVMARRVLDPLGGPAAVSLFEYNASGDVTRVTQPDGAWINYHYDDARRLTAISDRFENRIDYELDDAGNRLAERVKDSAGTLVRESRRVFDQLGRLEQQLDAQNVATVFGYDANSNLTETVDGLQRETRESYDALNRLRSTIQDYQGLNAETGFDYDAADNLVAVTDPNGLVTQYEYDGLRNLLQLTSPDTGVTDYLNDAAGNRIWQRDARNLETTYGFDALNRLVSIGYADASFNVSFEYDTVLTECPANERFSLGRLARMSDRSGETLYCYTARGQLARKLQTTGTTPLVVAYRHDLADRLERVIYPSGNTARYARDVMGRVTAVRVCPPGSACQGTDGTALVSSVNYQPFGAPSRIVFFGGRNAPALDFDTDLDGRVENLAGFEGALAFDYDAVGNLDYLSRSGGESRDFGYDPLNRLDHVAVPQQTTLEDYSYDLTGNRLSEYDAGTGLTLPYTYEPGSHRLTSRAGDVRDFDAAGNGTRIDAHRLVYGPNGRLIESRDWSSDSVLATYTHSGRGERVVKNVGEKPRLFAYDEQGALLGEYQGNGQPVWQFVWLDGRPVGALRGTEIYAIESDHLGTPRALRTATGPVVWRWDLLGSAFGSHAAQTDPDGNGVAMDFPLRYPGQYFDAEIGLHYNYFRDYEAATGRYVESDPIALRGGVNTYVYVSNNPIQWVDRRGLDGSPFCSGANGMLPPGYGNAHDGFCIPDLPPPPPRSDCRTFFSIGLWWANANIGGLGGRIEVDYNFSPEVGFTWVVCCKPTECKSDGSCFFGFNGNNYSEVSIGSGRRLGITIGAGSCSEICTNIGIGIGLPINFHHGG